MMPTTGIRVISIFTLLLVLSVRLSGYPLSNPRHSIDLADGAIVNVPRAPGSSDAPSPIQTTKYVLLSILIYDFLFFFLCGLGLKCCLHKNQIHVRQSIWRNRCGGENTRVPCLNQRLMIRSPHQVRTTVRAHSNKDKLYVTQSMV